ncbi:MAG: DNA-processing protein DprA [Clostridia bacterium]|nr:DNA-processing protein DprA [Clostridia bacterium]
MKCPPEYWIWLQRTLGAGKRLDNFFAYFGNPVNLYEAGHAEWIHSGVLSAKDAQKLVQFSPSQSYSIMKECLNKGWEIVTYDDDCYPERLRELVNPPCVLYVSGDKNILNYPLSIGMVGTRDASDYGLNVAQDISASLAGAGVVIVSGGALGVDSASHSGAVMAGGKTVAVLGCGLGCNYLASNEPLRRQIAENGAVISEFIPYTEPSKSTFPIRNRIISGMTLGTVVIEAGEKSGSLITAKAALEQGRDVFAVPGDITNSNHFGTNNLIRDGAKSVFSYMDVLCGYIDAYSEYINTDKRYIPPKKTGIKAEKAPVERKNRKTEQSAQVYEPQTVSPKKEENKMKPSVPDYASETAKKVFEYLDDEGILTDELVQKSGLPVHEVLSALTELEMYSLACMGSGKRYYVKFSV